MEGNISDSNIKEDDLLKKEIEPKLSKSILKWNEEVHY